MVTKILYRTISLSRTSYDWFKWGGIGEITTAPDWDPNPNIMLGSGLHAVGDGLWGDDLEQDKRYFPTGALLGYWEMLDTMLLQVVEAYDPVPAWMKDCWRFESAKVIEEYVLPEDIKEVLENHFVPPLYFLHCCKN